MRSKSLICLSFAVSIGLGWWMAGGPMRISRPVTDGTQQNPGQPVLAEGKPQDIVQNPEVRRVYLGENFRM